MSWAWRMAHLSPVGVPIQDFTTHSTPTIVSIDYMSVRGNGDCIEAVFRAVPSQVNIGLRDLVQIFIEDMLGSGSEIPIFYGVVVKAGSPRSHDVQEYRVAGLSKRVHEISPSDFVTIPPFDIISEDVSEAADRAAFYIPFGLVTSRDIPTLNFEVGPMILNRAPAGMILDELVKRVPGFTVPPGESYSYDSHVFGENDQVPFTEWGVTADKVLFFRRPMTSMELTEGAEVSNVVYESRVSEEMYTVAAAILPTNEGGSPAFLEYQDDDLVAQYGKSIKRFGIDSLFLPQTGISIISTPSGLSGFTLRRSTDNGNNWSIATDAEMETALQDRRGTTQVRLHKTQMLAINSNTYRVGVGYFWSDPQYVMEVNIYPKYGYGAPGVQIPGVSYERHQMSVFANILIAGNWIWEPFWNIPIGEESNVYINALCRGIMVGDVFSISDQYTIEYHIAELNIKTLDLDLVERLARSYFRRPPEDRVELTCYDEYVAPAAKCTFNPVDEDPFEMPVAEIRYSLTTEGGFTTTVILGQTYDPDALAEAEIMKKNMDAAATQVIDWATNNL